jgi:hypothetical protein
VTPTPPVPSPPAKQPWWQRVAIDVGKSAGLLLILDSAASAALKGTNVPAGDLAVITAVGVGLTALVSGLANFLGGKS